LEQKIKTLKEFWPFYLAEHSSRANRLLHTLGSTFALVFLSLVFYERNLNYLFFAIVSGYAFAWTGHFFIQKNRPATFKYPFFSFISDWKMFYYILSFQIAGEYKKYNIQEQK
jgi:hypothetical protein